ncbi:Exportin-T (Exportin(tRNA)) (tRNA exportin) [Durusdinium trenchii]|uniref:Exportin-T (Exportin(tRNA)) (tRNA exportin) n=1 Tax=Durusdinium trenchii TaxID=1381693 RepID=A0ABP0RA35_9DINO
MLHHHHHDDREPDHDYTDLDGDSHDHPHEHFSHGDGDLRNGNEDGNDGHGDRDEHRNSYSDGDSHEDRHRHRNVDPHKHFDAQRWDTVQEREMTATATSTLFVNTTEATTAAPTTSPRASTTSYEGPTQRLVVRVKVTKVQNNVDYITDSRVSTAYREVMQELTQLPTQMIDLQMVPQAPGNLTVSFILTVPEKDVTAVQETLKAETPAHFGAQVTRYVNTYVGEGLYTQEVVSIEEETSDYVGLNAAASLTALRSLLILGALQIARATEH